MLKGRVMDPDWIGSGFHDFAESRSGFGIRIWIQGQENEDNLVKKRTF
jgi:hypothetical protein